MLDARVSHVVTRAHLCYVGIFATADCRWVRCARNGEGRQVHAATLRIVGGWLRVNWMAFAPCISITSSVVPATRREPPIPPIFPVQARNDVLSPICT